MKNLIWPTLMIALLAGCADTPKKDALIEDRGVRAEAAKPGDAATKAADAKPVADKAADGKTAENKAADAAKTTQAAQARKEDPLAPKVQTQALTTQVAEVKPLQTQAAGIQAGGAAVVSPLRDPANPLSKRRLQFEYDSAAIREEYTAILEAHAKYLKGNKTANAILQGHADERGSREYNLALGQRRAEGVQKALQLLGVSDAQVEAVSLGEEKPLSDGHDEGAWQQNRRVEILYQGE